MLIRFGSPDFYVDFTQVLRCFGLKKFIRCHVHKAHKEHDPAYVRFIRSYSSELFEVGLSVAQAFDTVFQFRFELEQSAIALFSHQGRLIQ